MIRRAVAKEAESEDSEDSEDQNDESITAPSTSDGETSVMSSERFENLQRPNAQNKVFQHKVVRNGREIVLRTLKCCGHRFKRPTRMNDHFRSYHPKRDIPFPRRGGLHNHNVDIKERKEKRRQKYQRYNKKRRGSIEIEDELL